jgi:hypothetical protein
MVAPVCNFSTQETEARGYKFEASLGYIMSPYLKNKK